MTTKTAMLTARRLLQVKKHFSTQISNAVNLQKQLVELAPLLKPPVANKLLFSGGLKVMAVGGPNERDDYHIEVGEELFYQVKGTMNLKVILPSGEPHTVRIEEGEAFLLPAGVPHSPQRYADSFGLVFERQRTASELDCMRWYRPNSSKLLYEEYFHCSNLDIQVKEAIERFRSFKGEPPAPDANNFTHLKQSRIYEALAAKTPLEKPFALRTAAFNSHEQFLLKGEFAVQVIKGEDEQEIICPRDIKEVFLWQLQGRSYLHAPQQRIADLPLEENEISLITAADADGQRNCVARGGCPQSVLLAVTNLAPLH